MVGDANLFVNALEYLPWAEIEVMVAEPESRGRGLGKAAVTMMMAYGATALGVTTFVAKIGMANAPSLGLFASLGFREVSRSEVFQEVTLELKAEDETQRWLSEVASRWTQRSYEGGGEDKAV
jgi:L-amino acid N-acyltransferase YncA